MSEVDDAYRIILKDYFNRIEQRYLGNPNDRGLIISGLEGMLIKLGSTPDLQEPDTSKKFDNDYARNLRTSLSLSGIELARSLGIDPSAISRYENGKTLPPVNRPTGIKYLNWMKNQGYNPLDI